MKQKRNLKDETDVKSNSKYFTGIRFSQIDLLVANIKT